jgi:hypothetical protein
MLPNSVCDRSQKLVTTATSFQAVSRLGSRRGFYPQTARPEPVEGQVVQPGLRQAQPERNCKVSLRSPRPLREPITPYRFSITAA